MNDPTPRARILVVDDEAANLELMHDALHRQYALNLANSGEQAMALIANGLRPALVISDISMPGIDGYELIALLREHPETRETPVIFVTSHNSAAEESAGLEAGAADFIPRPVNINVLLARVQTQMHLVETHHTMRNYSQNLEREVVARTAEIERRSDELRSTHERSIYALTMLAETRDNETGLHIRRVEKYVAALINVLREMPRDAAELADPDVRNWMAKSAPLHDIGKVGIPDAILLKPGKLTDAEWAVMRKHPEIGERALAGNCPASAEPGFMRYAREIAGSHHEKWDGSGYPYGLHGPQIPLAARLMAVADVYDALISRRPYKPPFPHATAVTMIHEGAGKHFDPTVVEAFALCADDFARIAREMADEELPLSHPLQPTN
jgi:putative two-component system response regulator